MPTTRADIVPFWMSRVMHRESVLFIAETEAAPAAATLLFPPDDIEAVSSADGRTAYAAGRDYVVRHDTGRIHLPPGSRIPWLSRGDLHPAVDREGRGFMHARDDPARFLLFAEGDTFHRRQAVVTYAHAPHLWPGYAPRWAGAALPTVTARLEQRAPISLGVTGDSISEGYNASGYVGVPPAQAPYASLVADGLAQMCGAPVTLHNHAQAGTSSCDGVYAAGPLAALRPDLVLIAFGMNDAGYVEAGEFGANVRGIMTTIRRSAPAAEFVLVAPMLPHPDWHYPSGARLTAYRDTLAAACGPGVVLADLTRLWTELLARKSVYDLTGNGINHPNDFGHRLYAQVILSLLVADWGAGGMPAPAPGGPLW